MGVDVGGVYADKEGFLNDYSMENLLRSVVAAAQKLLRSSSASSETLGELNRVLDVRELLFSIETVEIRYNFVFLTSSESLAIHHVSLDSKRASVRLLSWERLCAR